jgi:membrane protease YdiL (CAAX protease family)
VRVPIVDRTSHHAPVGISRRLLVVEVLIVLALSLGRSGAYSIVSFVADLTSGQPLADQSAVINGSLAPGRPLLDLVRQVLRIAFSLAPVALVMLLLVRNGEGGPRAIGLDTREPLRDVGRGAALAALVGGVGLAGYLVAHASGANLTVVAQDLPDVWWRWPVLIAAALANAVVEEVIVAAYLVRRLRQLGWEAGVATAVSGLLRGTYHLYQGVGGFLGNLAMGVLFAGLYQRWGRVVPLIVAHALIDIVAFLGYALLAGHVDWLPVPN